jgi:hypothetical protein
MARWKATCFMNSSVGIQTVEVESNTVYGARQMVQQIYDPEQINSIHQVSDSNSSDFDIPLEGTASILIFVFFIWLFTVATPIVMMIMGGVLGTKFAELVSGDTLENALEDSLRTRSNSIVTFILFVTLFSGGTGFYFGNQIKQNYFSGANQPAQIKSNDIKK